MCGLLRASPPDQTYSMQNYFNYFTEIEERFQQRRGTLLMLSTLDWALIETWREAGVPLAAVLAGIDDAFARRAAKPARAKGRASRINGLAWCVQSVMEAAERQKEAATGLFAGASSAAAQESGFESVRVARFLERNADALTAAVLPAPVDVVAREIAARLRELAVATHGSAAPTLEALDMTLTALEQKLIAAVLSATTEAELVGLREQATRELAPYRGKMQAVQIRQVQQQFLEKRLMATRGLARLSLFYMSHE